MTKHGLPDIERFLPKIDKDPETGCWNWTAAQQGTGYGVFAYGQKASGGMGLILSHRFSYMHFRGEIPEGTEIDHLCRNRKCANPDHLEAVTRQVNQLRGNSVSGQAARRTHCPQGHAYNEKNTYVNPNNGSRSCRICRRNMARTAVPRYKARLRALAQGEPIPPWAKKLT